MRSGWDARRRNRNIGTEQQGHGHSNRDRIPRRRADSVLEWKRVPEHVVVRRHIWGRDLPFVVEATRSDSWHACTVDDIATMLRALPARHIDACEDIDGLQGIVLRQPTRKEETLHPVWGRLGFSVDVGPLCGPVIFMEAQSIPLTVKWTRKLSLEDRMELDRLMEAATAVRSDSRRHELTFDIEGVRRVQLYHTLPHEVGHWADMFENVEIPSHQGDFEAWKVLWDRYWQRPTLEREAYAHSYAVQAAAQLRRERTIPFARQLDVEAMLVEGLRIEDFLG